MGKYAKGILRWIISKNQHNSAADGDTLVFESPAAATNANGEPADGGNSGFFKKTFASVRSFFAKLFSDKKGANEINAFKTE